MYFLPFLQGPHNISYHIFTVCEVCNTISPVGVLGVGRQGKLVWWYTHTNTLIYILVSDILMAVLYCSICNYIIVHVSSHWHYCGLLWTSLITSYQSYIALHPSLNEQKIYQYKRCCSHCHPPYCLYVCFQIIVGYQISFQGNGWLIETDFTYLAISLGWCQNERENTTFNTGTITTDLHLSHLCSGDGMKAV